MAKYTEPIVFLRSALVSDGAGGKESNGTATQPYTCLAEVEEKTYPKMGDANNPTFRNYYNIFFWKDPSFEPIETDTIEYRGKNLVIQEIKSTDRNYTLIAIAKR